eukprot:m.130963 g.130963  ORF g.130963 m.130963 type:complete len:837 (+) comp13736_c0_seq4:348-2858(+)
MTSKSKMPHPRRAGLTNLQLSRAAAFALVATSVGWAAGLSPTDPDSQAGLVTHTGVVLVVCEQFVNPETGAISFHEYTLLDPQDGSSGVLLTLPASVRNQINTFDTVSVVGVNGNRDRNRRDGNPPPRLRHLRHIEVSEAKRTVPLVPTGPDGSALAAERALHSTRRRKSLHVGGRSVLAICVTMKSSGGRVKPAHCGESSVRAIFSTGQGGNVDGFFRFATHDRISFPDNLLSYAEVTADSLDVSMNCDLPQISATADTLALNLRVTLQRANAFCLHSQIAPGNGHAYNSPERCAARCMCNVDFDAPSNIRHFSLFRNSQGAYACYCGASGSGSECPSGDLINYNNFNVYSFEVGGGGAQVSESEFCAAGNHRLYLIPEQVQSCQFAAAAYICGDDSEGPCHLYSRTNSGYAISHEIGHNLGLGHAAADVGNNGGVPGSSAETYGDYTDVMGTGWHGFAQSFNSGHREILGLLSDSHTLDLTIGNGVMPCATRTTLLSLHVDPSTESGTQVVRFPRSAARGGGTYFISYRAALWYDAGLEGSASDYKVHVHYVGGTLDTQTGADTHLVGIVTSTVPFQDKDTGVTIRLRSSYPCTTSLTAAIEIDWCNPGPSRDSPTYPDGHTFNGFTLVAPGRVCFPADSAIGTFNDVSVCAAACRNRCGCSGFTYHRTIGHCHLSTGPGCCRGGLGSSADTRYDQYRLDDETGDLCPIVAITGIPGFEGTYEHDTDSARCEEIFRSSDGRTVRWRQNLRRWCFRDSSVDAADDSNVCSATSPGYSDDFTVGAGAVYSTPNTVGFISTPTTPVAECLAVDTSVDRTPSPCTGGCRRGARPMTDT